MRKLSETHHAAAEGRIGNSPQRLLIDAPTRIFHWLFAFGFLGAYVTAEGERFRDVHVMLGYLLGGLLLFRLVYAAVGPRRAGLGALYRRQAAGLRWLASLLRRPLPIGGRMVQAPVHMLSLGIVALLLMVVPLTLSGYATYNEWGGSLAEDWLEEVHEALGQIFLVTVCAHLAAIALLGLRGRWQLVVPMLTGRAPGGD